MAKDHYINPKIRPGLSVRVKNRKDVSELHRRILQGDRYALSEGITLMESRSENLEDLAYELLDLCLHESGKAKRIGVTGSPGVGKSTFIESFGLVLIDKGNRPAILAVDPSSTVTKGSILGDKTRMKRLSEREEAYIRPSPSAGFPGGITEHSYQAMILCEAAGFDPVIIETVGVGQSETKVRNMVDIFILLVQPGAGDEIQGMKKGIMEISDLILMNKCDREFGNLYNESFRSLQDALRLLRKSHSFRSTDAFQISSLENTGLVEVWGYLEQFYSSQDMGDYISRLRRHQELDRFDEMTKNALMKIMLKDEKISKLLDQWREAINKQSVHAFSAVRELIVVLKEKLSGPNHEV